MGVRPMAVPERLLIDYPQLWELEDGTEVTVRPMVKEDRDKLAEFFKRIPDQELRVLKDDVTGGTVIDQWAQRLDYDRLSHGDRSLRPLCWIRARSDRPDGWTGRARRSCSSARQ